LSFFEKALKTSPATTPEALVGRNSHWILKREDRKEEEEEGTVFFPFLCSRVVVLISFNPYP
jgi:hypothetical protein